MPSPDTQYLDIGPRQYDCHDIRKNIVVKKTPEYPIDQIATYKNVEDNKNVEDD